LRVLSIFVSDLDLGACVDLVRSSRRLNLRICGSLSERFLPVYR
jgi:hypothetical protein